MKGKSALGRGLSALIPSVRADESDPRMAGQVLMVDVAKISVNRRQPRKKFDEEALQELAASIRESGLLQPPLVTREGDGYRIVAGERRFRAAQAAGLQSIPVLVREGLAEKDFLLMALVENIQRHDLTALEEAEAYRVLRDEFGMTQDGIAEKVGRDRATVANTLRLLKLSSPVRTLLDDGALSAGHARAILPLPSAEDQEKVAREVVQKGLTVRQTEARVAALMEAVQAKKVPPDSDPHTRDAERRLQRVLSTKVEIRRRKKGGEVRISFYSEEQLIGLFDRLIREDA